ncbi:MAG: glycosyltransferase family 39 protein [Candidatus Eisenbacteria bacterium]
MPQRSSSNSRWHLALAAMFGLTLTWRLFALARLAGSPLMGELTADSGVYWLWAGEIRSGSWVGHQAFFLGPLYPYVLAVVRELWGDSLRTVLTLQCVLGACSVVLLADTARRLTSSSVACVIAALLGMLTMGTFFDLLILMESLLFALSALTMWLVVSWDWTRRPILGATLVGLCVGLSAQGRATHVLLIVPFAGFLFATLHRSAALRAALASGAMIILMALPTAIRHRVLVGEWIPYTYSLGYNAYVGNGPDANGSFVVIPGSEESEDPIPGSVEGGTGSDGRSYQRRRQGVDLSPAQSSSRWLDQTLAYVAREPVRTARRFVIKLGLLVNHREVPQIENVAVHERILGPLGPPGLGSFLPLGCLGLVGLALAARSNARARFALGMLVTLAVSTAAFFVTDRYRHQLMPAFSMLAAITLQRMGDHWRRREPERFMGFALALVLACGLTALPLVPFNADQLAWETDSTVGAAQLRRGDDALAVQTLGHAVALEQAGRLPHAEWATAKVMRAGVRENLAIAQSRTGDRVGALRSYREAAALAPKARALHADYGKVAAMLEHGDEARTALAIAEVGPREAAAELFADASQAQAHADGAGLEAALRGIITLQPNDERARVALVRSLILAKRYQDAAVELEHARTAGLDAQVHIAHQVLLAASRGDSIAATRWRSRLAARTTADPRVRATLQMVPR